MPVGLDGIAVLLLSVMVAVGTAGSSLVLALAVVLRTAWRTPSDVPEPFGIVAVLGHRLDKHGRPTPAFLQRLRRGRRCRPVGRRLREAALLHWHQTGWLLARVGRIGALARRIG